MEEEQELASYVRAYTLAVGSLPSMFTRAACLLGIPDILHAHPGQPLSALQLTSLLPFPRPPPPPPPFPTAAFLDRILRFLSSHGVFEAHASSPTTYSLTPISKWLLKPHHRSPHAPSSGSSSGDVGAKSDDDVGTKGMSLHDFVLFQTCGVLQPPLQHVAQFILEGGEGPFYKAHGIDGWSFLNADSEFSNLFNAGMACDADIAVALLLQNYQGFDDVHTLVDVGGGTGIIASRIITRYPSIQAFNFDLPYVVAAAPTYPGVEHIGGDMFQDIPTGDAIFLRSTLHTWDDESCIKILKNCHKALPKHGKLIIMEIVLSDDCGSGSPLKNLQMALDMLMMVNTNGGERKNQTRVGIHSQSSRVSNTPSY